MDIKTELINEIIGEMNHFSTNNDALNHLRNILYIKLNSYDILKKSTELVISNDDDSTSALVRKFFATKRLKGMSEKSINLYYPYINKLLTALDKPIFAVTIIQRLLFASQIPFVPLAFTANFNCADAFLTSKKVFSEAVLTIFKSPFKIPPASGRRLPKVELRGLNLTHYSIRV